MSRVRCTTKSLIIRDAPNGNDTQKRLLLGDEIEVTGSEGKWLRTVQGWISADYVVDVGRRTIDDFLTSWFSIEKLSRAAGIPMPEAERWYPHIVEAVNQFRINTPQRLAAWIAQCGHESAGFKTLAENLNYSARGLRSTWPSRFDEAKAAQYQRNPKAIANYVYSGRMGNGPEESGDGWRFKGRGLIQLTGRSNYARCSIDLGIDLVAQPDLLLTEAFASKAAAWFWAVNGLNELADRGDIAGLTRRINGGTHGLDDRTKRWIRAKQAFGID